MPTREPAAPAADDLLPTIPLTDAQQGVWLSHQIRPGDVDLHIVRAFRVTGPLDDTALACALDRLATAHPALRSVHPFDVDGPVRRVLPAPGTAPWRDLGAGTDPELAGFLAQTFDLEVEPPMRAGLSGGGPDGSRLLAFCFHHIVMDGVSAAVFCRDLAGAYRAALAGTPLTPAEPIGPVPRRDPHTDRSAGYWAGRLNQLPEPLLDAPSSRVPAAGRPAQSHRLRRGAADAAALREAARVGRATPHMVLTAAYATALGRIFGRDEVVVGTTVSLRRPGEADVIDCLVTMLPLLVHLDTDGPALLAQVRERSLEAQRHRTVSSGVLARCAGAAPMEPLFQAAVDLQHVPPPRLPLPGCRTQPYTTEPDTVQYPVDLDARLTDDGLHLVLRTDATVVAPQQAAQLLEAIGDLLPSAGAPPTGVRS